jgi:hypothetical protein
MPRIRVKARQRVNRKVGSKPAVDRGIDQGLEDIRAGRFIGPFSSAKEALKALRAKARGQKQPRAAVILTPDS